MFLSREAGIGKKTVLDAFVAHAPGARTDVPAVRSLRRGVAVRIRRDEWRVERGRHDA